MIIVPPDGLHNVVAVGVDPPGQLQALLHVGLLVVHLPLHHRAQLNEGPLQLSVLVVDLLLDPLNIVNNLIDPRPVTNKLK